MPFTYPLARQQSLIENYHGTQVADPYRWLEDPTSQESRSWTASQNLLTRQFLDQPLREGMVERLKTLCAYTRTSAPFRRGDKLFFWKSEGLQNQPVLYWQSVAGGEAHQLLNPNQLSRDGIVSVFNAEPSRDGRYLAYSLSYSGSDWQKIHVVEIESGLEQPEVLEHTKFSGIAWHPDGSGFFYNRYPEATGLSETEQTYHNKVYWHQLGTEQSADTLIYERPDQKDFDFYSQISEDGQFLVLWVMLGTDRRKRIYYLPLDQVDIRSGRPSDFKRLLDKADADYHFLGNLGQEFYFQTDYQAAHGQILKINLAKPEPADWQTLVPEHPNDTLSQVLLAGEQLVAVYLSDAHHRIKIFDLKGSFLHEIALPTLGAISEIHGLQHDSQFYFGFSSFLFPARSYRYDLATQELTLFFASSLDFDAEQYVTRQVFARSKDGTRVPMFLVHKADLELNSQTPTMMYGYGGFRQALTPNFTASLLPWLEQGGLYCLVNTRGGFEYGTPWYQAGTLERKQNVFDDFISAGEHLIEQGWTSAHKLAIRGGSNGGLLVGACMLQKPELFGAVVCQVPVLDMLRYHQFTIGRYWVSDYGNAEENPEHFHFLIKYSPLHNIKSQTDYPPILITTADHDDRVVPAHAYKFAATLQAQNPQNQTLLRVDTDAGHGRGKPLSKVIEEMADIYCFLAQTLKITWR